MATLAGVYSVDRYVRTPEQIVAALFRDVREEPLPSDDTRPEPNASTEGVRSVFPSLPPVTPQGTAQPLKSGAGQSEGTGEQ